MTMYRRGSRHCNNKKELKAVAVVAIELEALGVVEWADVVEWVDVGV